MTATWKVPDRIMRRYRFHRNSRDELRKRRDATSDREEKKRLGFMADMEHSDMRELEKLYPELRVDNQDATGRELG